MPGFYAACETAGARLSACASAGPREGRSARRIASGPVSDWVDYIEDAAQLNIYLGSGHGPATDFVLVERETGSSIDLAFNEDGYLIGITVIGQIEKMIPADFLAHFAQPS